MEVEVSDGQLRSWRRQGMSHEDIAARTGMTEDEVAERITTIWRDACTKGTSFVCWNELTIALRASAVRQHWSPEVEESRRVTGSGGWIPPDAPWQLEHLT